MKLLQVAEQNKPYYSADYTKGFNDGAKAQYEADRKDAERSLWFHIGEVCVDESKGFISAGRAVEKIRELLRGAERVGGK